MAEQNTVDRDAIKLQPLAPVGLLDQFNLPTKTIRFIRRHQRIILTTLSALVVLAVVVAAYSTYREHVAAKATAALDAALDAKQDNRRLLEEVVRGYGSTSAGLWARIELGFLDEREGQRAQAIARLTEVNAGLGRGTHLKPLLLNKLAGLHEQERQFDQAIALATELATIEGFAPLAYRTLGRLNEQMGRKEEAAAMYGKYLELTEGAAGPGGADPIRDMVQTRINLLKN